ncbi:hypothetical protein RB597_007352 [Gaeumannomyces tritici]
MGAEKLQPDVEQTSLPTSGDAATDDEPPYSVFSAGEKWLLVCIVGLAMLFSPLTANIYFPAMAQLRADLGATEQEINLTVTAYLALQAVAPVLLGDLADSLGRRPAFLAMFSVYTAASAGLGALRRGGGGGLGPLMALRAAQSVCSAAVAVSYGVVADVATPAERGGMVGAAMVAVNLGPALAPMLGGGILAASGGDWRWIFWFLVMCGGAVLSLVACALPETARGIVGNSAVVPRSLWRRPLATACCGIRIPAAARLAAPGGGGGGGGAVSATPGAAVAPAGPNPASTPPPPASTTATPRRRLPNPLRSVRLLFYRDSSLVLLVSGVFYMVYYCLQASIATLFKRIYGFDDGVIGACYLAVGSGVVLGGYLNGRLLDWNYKTTAREAGIEVDRKRGDDMSRFPIEMARLRSMQALQFAHLVVLVGYGWALEKAVHVSVPLILQFILGFLQTCIVQTGNTLLVDIFQESPSAAAASGNIVRCGLSAGGIAAMGPLMAGIGPGFFFAALALFGTICGVAGTHVLLIKGMQWRLDRTPLGCL